MEIHSGSFRCVQIRFDTHADTLYFCAQQSVSICLMDITMQRQTSGPLAWCGSLKASSIRSEVERSGVRVHPYAPWGKRWILFCLLSTFSPIWSVTLLLVFWPKRIRHCEAYIIQVTVIKHKQRLTAEGKKYFKTVETFWFVQKCVSKLLCWPHLFT